LDFLGFPWILSSESRLFNGLRGIFAGRNFARPFAAAAEASRESSSVLGMQKRRIIHLSNLAWFLILCKELLSTEIASELPSRHAASAAEQSNLADRTVAPPGAICEADATPLRSACHGFHAEKKAVRVEIRPII
jgi:hypothetical protein